MSNFQFLKGHEKFHELYSLCDQAEKLIVNSPRLAAAQCRYTLEYIVYLIYKIEQFEVPHDKTLSSLMYQSDFRNFIDDPDVFKSINYIRRIGNAAVHYGRRIKYDEALLSLKNLHAFTCWFARCYTNLEVDETFDESLLTRYDVTVRLDELQKKLEEKEQEIHKLNLIIENKVKAPYVKPQFMTEKETRERYIDLYLREAGWEIVEKKNVKVPGQVGIEIQVQGMPNESGVGYVDYVLYDDSNLPLAIIEAKKTSSSSDEGKYQAKLYADCLERETGRRPVIFYSNGYDIWLWDDTEYPPRKVSGFYTKDDLEWLIQQRHNRESLEHMEIKDEITDRYYQKMAITRVCESFTKKRRKALLVMATGTGKTRTAISLVDVLIRKKWIKRVLFLADRKALVEQAERNFNHLLPNVPTCNLLKERDYTARIYFSTYQTMINILEEKPMERPFGVGHFDLLIIDEAHRSIFNKFQIIFDYFDALMLGLTATPKDEVDRNTYEVFDLENQVPTYAYGLDEAVKDGYLVPYHVVSVQTKFIQEGIKYEELSEEEKERYEQDFITEEGYIPKYIESYKINKSVMNADTIDKVLSEVMQKGIKVSGGDKLGKTIIFAVNHHHAQLIVDRFNHLYPEYKGQFCQLIDNTVSYALDLIGKFSARDQMPQIAVSVDMLDTGIDIPDVVNLVFFKAVRSKAKFWQMIGRGTRLSPDLFGPGKDKEYFVIFDICDNFGFFSVNPHGKESPQVKSLTQHLFEIKLDILHHLQSAKHQNAFTQSLYEHLKKELIREIRRLNPDHPLVRKNLQYVDQYSQEEAWDHLTAIDIGLIKKHLGPLILPSDEEETAKRFDYLMYGIILSLLDDHIERVQSINRVKQLAFHLEKRTNIPHVARQMEWIKKVQDHRFWEHMTIESCEQVRTHLRDLIKFLDQKKHRRIIYTDLEDEIVYKGNVPPLIQDDLKTYRKRVEEYLYAHYDNPVIQKIRFLEPLTEEDLKELERIFWEEIGTKEDYYKEFKDLSLGALVRTLVSLDHSAINQKFSEFLNRGDLTANQQEFIKTIIDYIKANGYIKKTTIIEDPEFARFGGVTNLFGEDAQKLVSIIDEMNEAIGIYEI
ncbi:MAG TPA: DEAD/DEAH box helicase family protein [Haloplasmataceae bacterium]